MWVRERLEEDGRENIPWDERDLTGLLEVFAGLTYHRSGVFPAFSGAEQQALTVTPGLMLILLSWDSRRRQFVDSLREQGVDLRVIVVGPGSRAPKIDETVGFAVSAKDLLAGEMRELSSGGYVAPCVSCFQSFFCLLSSWLNRVFAGVLLSGSATPAWLLAKGSPSPSGMPAATTASSRSTQ